MVSSKHDPQTNPGSSTIVILSGTIDQSTVQWLCYGYESYIVGKVLTRAIFRCIKNFGDVSSFCVIVFFLFLARVGGVTVLVRQPLERSFYSGNFGIRHKLLT